MMEGIVGLMSENRNYILTCCSTADMPPEFFRDRNIAYVPFHFTLDGITYPDDLGQSMPFDVFYQKITDGASATTSQVNVAEFHEFFGPFLEKGLDIIHVSLSSAISGEFGSANIARDELLEKYPERKIALVDSRGASSGYGLLIRLLADRRDAGTGFDELVSWAEDNKHLVHHWFFSTDLTSYIRGGRISKAAGLFGTLLNICPLMNMDEAGRLVPREKIRTKKRVIRAIVDRMRENAQGGADYSGKCFISHSACHDDARAVADLIEAEFPALDGRVSIYNVGTVIGSHTGPGTVALFFLGGRRID